MEEILVRSLGEGKSLATVENPSREIRVDSASVKDREHFSPTDLLAAGLSSCILANMDALLEKNGFDPMDFEIRVLKEMTGPPRRIASLTLEVLKPSAPDESLRKLFRKAMEHCPVKRSLSEEIRIELHFSDFCGKQ